MPAHPDDGGPDGDPGPDPGPGADPWFGLAPDRARRIGASVEGRAIHAWCFGVARAGGQGVGAPTLLVVGGVHGDEPSSVAATAELGQRLAAGDVRAPGLVWVVPALNPDGLLRGHKNSARDVDLNRNFPAASFSSRHQPGYFPGAHPLSEPETSALAGLIEQEKISAVVAVHAPFACVNYDGPAAEWAGRVAAACGWPARADIGYPTPGSLGSWLGIDRRIPILTLELPPGPIGAFRDTCRITLDEALRVTL